MDQASGWSQEAKEEIGSQEADLSRTRDGGLGIPYLDETINGFQQNPIQGIYKLNRTNPAAKLPSILAGLLIRANRPALAGHVQGAGTQRAEAYKQQSTPWNKLT
jgi:hypothetical protein